jgi:hypothetical protein
MSYCHIAELLFFLKEGGKKENHMTQYDNMAGRVRQGLGRVIYTAGTDMTPYDNMTQLANLHSEAIDVNSSPEAADVPYPILEYQIGRRVKISIGNMISQHFLGFENL